mmetsp:Transcript_19288/g.56290  ORF Transcript_19288/g.56290 Transcript_19288/m.56290 type:complete len:350 (+) Transcript_19288:1440-2489(+)
MAFMRSTPAMDARLSDPARAMASCMPPNSAMGTRNCFRTRAYAPVADVTFRAAPTDPAGRDTPRPSARHSTNMFHPKPHRSCPPRMRDMGIQTFSPSTVPFMKEAERGMWRGPMRRPGWSRLSGRVDFEVSESRVPERNILVRAIYVIAKNKCCQNSGGESKHTHTMTQDKAKDSLKKRHGEALVPNAVEQTVGVAQVESQAHHSGHGRQRNVPLLEGRHDAQFAVYPLYDAVAPDETRGVAPRVRSGQSEARDESPVCQAGQEVRLLLGRAVPREQFAGTERIGNGDGGVGIEALGGQLLKDRRDGRGGELKSSPLLRYFQPEELFVAHVIPCLAGEIAFDGHVVIVQ